MTRAKRWFVNALEQSCVLTHRWPLTLLPGRHCKPAHWSLALDKRWGTGVWEWPDGGVAER